MPNSYLFSGPVVDVSCLRSHFQNGQLKIVEAKMPPLNAPEDWESGYKIPGAVQMDINADFSALETDLPHMLPDEAYFSKAARALGFNNEDTLVVYDQVGTYSSPRAWWMLRAMGHERVYVLNGGFPAWQAAGFEVERAVWVKPNNGDFRAKPNPSRLKTAEEVLVEIEEKGSWILDARPRGRFEGNSPEPRPGLRGGHIPGSICLPFQTFQNGNYMKPAGQIKAIFDSLDLEGKHLTMTCGSGVTASILALAAEMAGYENVAVYDGSWAEWGKVSAAFPIESGAV